MAAFKDARSNSVTCRQNSAIFLADHLLPGERDGGMSKGLTILLVAGLIGWAPVILFFADPPALTGDEAYYARVPVEMREREDWLVPYFNGEPRYKKPPLMYWLVASSQWLLGENEVATRLPSLVAVWLTGLLLWWFGRRIGEGSVGLGAAFAFWLNPMSAFLGNWGAPEAVLGFFVAASILLGFLSRREKNGGWLVLSGVAAGLGVLTKGAPGITLPFLALFPVWLIGGREDGFKGMRDGGVWLLACCLVAAPWFLAVGMREGEAFWRVLLWREHFHRVTSPMEGHRGPLWFYLPVLWFLFFPWSIRLPSAFFKSVTAVRQPLGSSFTFDPLFVWWAISVVGLFSLVATKLPHYIFPAFPAVAWLCAQQWQRDWERSEKIGSALLALVPVGVALYGSVKLPQAYMETLAKLGFEPQGELGLVQHAGVALGGSILLAGMGALVALVERQGERRFLLGVGSAAICTFGILLGVHSALKVMGGREAAIEWRRSPVIATFGSDTHWAVFYADRPVPLLGRDRRRLKAFLTKHPQAAILLRVDFAPPLREEGWTIKRYGIWCIARKPFPQ